MHTTKPSPPTSFSEDFASSNNSQASTGSYLSPGNSLTTLSSKRSTQHSNSTRSLNSRYSQLSNPQPSNSQLSKNSVFTIYDPAVHRKLSVESAIFPYTSGNRQRILSDPADRRRSRKLAKRWLRLGLIFTTFMIIGFTAVVFSLLGIIDPYFKYPVLVGGFFLIIVTSTLVSLVTEKFVRGATHTSVLYGLIAKPKVVITDVHGVEQSWGSNFTTTY